MLLSILLLQCVYFTSTSFADDNMARPETEVEWKRIGTGVLLGVAKLPGALFPGEVTFVKTGLSHFQLRIVRAEGYGKKRATVASLAQKSGAPICINGNFF